MTHDPNGIEEILALAAVDPEFGAALERDRTAAIEASGVALSPAERGILQAVDEPTLKQMTASIASLLSEQDRRAFLGRAAAAAAALLGVGAASGCREPVAVTGSRPDPPPEPTPPPRPTSQPAEPTRPIGGLMASPDARVPAPPPAPTGSRPDRPPESPTRGIRPDRPHGASRGIRPDRPTGRTGIRPDRPK